MGWKGDAQNKRKKLKNPICRGTEKTHCAISRWKITKQAINLKWNHIRERPASQSARAASVGTRARLRSVNKKKKRGWTNLHNVTPSVFFSAFTEAWRFRYFKTPLFLQWHKQETTGSSFGRRMGTTWVDNRTDYVCFNFVTIHIRMLSVIGVNWFPILVDEDIWEIFQLKKIN